MTKKINLKQFKSIFAEVAKELNVKVDVNNIFRYCDATKKGSKVKFISYGSNRYEAIYVTIASRLNDIDNGGWIVANRGSWYGDGSGWCVIKVYEKN